MRLHNRIFELPRQNFLVYDLESDVVLGHYHRQTEKNVYYYAISSAAWGNRKSNVSKRVKKTQFIHFLYNRSASNVFYVDGSDIHSIHSIRDSLTNTNNYSLLGRRVLLNEKLANLNMVLGQDNFVLTTKSNRSTITLFDTKIRSVMCKTKEDSILARLILNQS